jgi:hypothetical protein
LDGTWSGILKLSSGGQAAPEVPIILMLQQRDSTLAGTLTPTGKNSVPIQHGKVEGASVSFDMLGENPSLKFTGTLTNGHLMLYIEGTLRVGEQERPLKGSADMDRQR